MSPTSAEVVQRLRALAKAHPRLAKVKQIGASGEGRPLHTVTITDPGAKASDKQHAMIVGGRHGNEESGRLLALGLAEWLLSPAGRTTRRKQKVVILPNANPDACERDIYATPKGIHVCHDVDAKKPIPETVALLKVADEVQPDLFIDLHSRGGGGCSYDMVLYPDPKNYTIDDNLFHQVCFAMCEAGEKKGIPQLSHPLSWWSASNNGACHICYRRYKSLSLLTETAESNTHCHPESLRKKSGVAKLITALEYGNRHDPKLPYAGYPNLLAIGSYNLGIVAWGKTAAARRQSRVGIWENVHAFAHLGGVNPVPDKLKTYRLVYKGKTVKPGLAIQVQARHRQGPKSVRLKGRKLRKGGSQGYTVWRDKYSSFVLVPIPACRRGTYEIEIAF